jgi:hypothetical protein
MLDSGQVLVDAVADLSEQLARFGVWAQFG